MVPGLLPTRPPAELPEAPEFPPLPTLTFTSAIDNVIVPMLAPGPKMPFWPTNPPATTPVIAPPDTVPSTITLLTVPPFDPARMPMNWPGPVTFGFAVTLAFVDVEVAHVAGGADRAEQADADADTALRRGRDGQIADGVSETVEPAGERASGVADRREVRNFGEVVDIPAKRVVAGEIGTHILQIGGGVHQHVGGELVRHRIVGDDTSVAREIGWARVARRVVIESDRAGAMGPINGALIEYYCPGAGAGTVGAHHEIARSRILNSPGHQLRNRRRCCGMLPASARNSYSRRPAR